MNYLIVDQNVSQLFEDATNQMLLTNIENVVVFIFLSTAILLIVSTPVLLLYSSIDSFFKRRILHNTIDISICIENKKCHKSFEKQICSEYKEHQSIFVGSIFGIVIWITASIFYISQYSQDFTQGIFNYFNFPFEILGTYDFTNSIQSITEYQTSWYFMLGIFIVSIFAYLLGKIIAPYLMEASVSRKIASLAVS